MAIQDNEQKHRIEGTSKEDKYIELLKEGPIDKEEFLALMGVGVNKHGNPMFG